MRSAVALSGLPHARGVRPALVVAAAVFVLGCPLSLDAQEPGTRAGTLRCEVTANQVHLTWDPPARAQHIEAFVVLRNGETLATLRPSRLEYTDRAVPLGEHVYLVVASRSRRNAEDIAVGRCQVTIECFGLRRAVEGLEVKLDWSHAGALDTRQQVFFLRRDGRVVAETRETRHTDSVPGPGRYLYTVSLGLGGGVLAPESLIAQCEVTVPRPGSERPPAPEDLQCLLATALPDPIPEPFPIPQPPARLETDSGAQGDSDAEAVIFPLPPTHPLVVLQWSNPIRYDEIVVTRDGTAVATLRGTQTAYRDIPSGGGEIVYGVTGVAGGHRSERVECTVELPRVLPPAAPEELSCQPLSAVLTTDGSLELADGRRLVAPLLPPHTVILRWRNPTRYARILVQRDGESLARLAGSATLYLDTAAVPGSSHLYEVFGIAGDGTSSAAAQCEVKVPEPDSTLPHFVRGDFNGDLEVGLEDVIALLLFLLREGEPPGCLEAADANGDSAVNLADAIAILQWKMAGGRRLPHPFPDCDAGRAPLGCATPPACPIAR